MSIYPVSNEDLIVYLIIFQFILFREDFIFNENY